MKKLRDRCDYLSVVLTIVAFTSSFFTDSRIFSELQVENLGYYVFDKCIYFALLLCFWKWILKAIIGGIKQNSFEWRLLTVSLIYMVVFLICIYFIYPAVEFGGDMPYFIGPAKEYRINGGLHWLSTLFYVIGYMAFPISGGPTILMAVASSISYGYVAVKAKELGVRNIWIALLFIPPFIIFGIYPTRMTMMTLAFMVYYTWLHDNYNTRAELSKTKIFFFLIMTGMLSVWRMEGKYLLIFAPLFILLAFNIKLNLKNFFRFFCLVLAAYLVFSVPDYFREKITIEKRLVPIVGYMLPLMEMEGVDYRNSSQYDVLNQYIDMENLSQYEDELGLKLYMSDYLTALDGVYRNDSATVSTKEYVWAAIRACLENPIAYLKVRIKSFVITANGSVFPFAGLPYNEDGTANPTRKWCLFVLDGTRGLGVDIIHDNLWKSVMKYFMYFLKNIIWQLWITFIAMIVIMVKTIRKKDILSAVYGLGMWIFASIVFLFAPGCIFKYYWPVYTFCIMYFMFNRGMLGGKESTIEKS